MKVVVHHSGHWADGMAFGERVAHLLSRLRPRAVNLCRGAHDVDDLMQQTALQALQYQSSFQEGTNLGAWLNTIMQHVFLSSMRGRKFDGLTVEFPDNGDALRVAHPTACADVERYAEMSLLFDRVDRLPAKQRALVVGVLCEGEKLPRSGAKGRALNAAKATLAEGYA